MHTINHDLKSLALPKGWYTTESTLKSGEPCLLLSATRPAETLRFTRHLPHECRPVFGLYRHAGKFCEMAVKCGENGYWRHVRPARFINDSGGSIQEARLDPIPPGNQTFYIKPAERQGSMCGIAWIKFEKADNAEPKWQKHDVGAVCDTHGMFAKGGIADASEIEAMLAPFVESDFDRICWGIGAGSFRMLYFSEILPYFGQEKTTFYNEANTRVAATMAAMRKRNHDPLDLALQFCHRHGMALWANDRICHCWPPGGFNDDFAAPFYLQNQHLRTINVDGERQATLSLAHREFQDLKISLYRELAERGVDGIYIDLQRKPGLMGIDDPVVAEFEKQTGRPPEKSDYRTEPWLKIRAAFVTDFMRRVRCALDEVGKEQNRRIEIAVQGFAGRIYTGNAIIDENMMQGYDIRTWAQEGLIDIFAPSTSRHYQPVSLFAFADMLEGTPCSLWGCLGQHHDSLFPTDYNHNVYFGNDPEKHITPIADLDPLRVMRNAADYYAQGAQGVFLWEAGEVPNCPVRWDYLRTLGHREEWRRTFTPEVGPFDGRHHIPQWRAGL